MSYSAVIFSVKGVLAPNPQLGTREYENSIKLPTGFLEKVFTEGSPDNSFCKLERGELLFTEFLKEFDKEVREMAKQDGVCVAVFDAVALFDKIAYDFTFQQKEFLGVLKVLRRNNIKTCALFNNWIEDRADHKNAARRFISGIRWYFDDVVESSVERIRQPDPKIYNLACEKMKVNPTEAIFIDFNDANLKSAADVGMACINVGSVFTAIQQLQVMIRLDLSEDRFSNEVYPPPCRSGDVPHSIASLKSGIQMHYVDVGHGPVVMLLHGFPGLWYSWRYQIPAITTAGYRVIATDHRGFGGSSAPYEIEELTQEKLCKDVICLMDCLGISQVTVVGHDWGGQVAWNAAQFFPHRLQGVGSLTFPLLTGIGAKKMQEQREVLNYQIYFQPPGVAEKEFEKDLARTFKLFFRGIADEPLDFPDGKKIKRDSTNVTERGGMWVGYPEDVPRGKLLTEDDLAYFVQQYGRNGFRAPLNIYRNRMAMMQWQALTSRRKIVLPAIMISASHDVVATPEFTLGMEERVPHLTRVVVQNCGHWVQVEKSDEVNDALIKWLDGIHNKQQTLQKAQ